MIEWILTFAFFVLIGVAIYSLDLFIKAKFFKKKDVKQYKGIVIGRKLLWKVIIAGIAMIGRFWAVNKFFTGHVDLSKIFVSVVFEWASVIAGFYLAPWIRSQWPKIFKRGSAYAEKLEKGEVNPLKDMKDAVISSIKKTDVTDKIVPKDEKAEVVPAEVVTTMAVEEKKEEKDNRSSNEKMKDAVDDFLKK